MVYMRREKGTRKGLVKVMEKRVEIPDSRSLILNVGRRKPWGCDHIRRSLRLRIRVLKLRDPALYPILRCSTKSRPYPLAKDIITVKMVGYTAALALALVPFTLAQVSEDFEGGWDQTAWPTYAIDCNQGGTVELDSTDAHSGTNSIKVTGGASGYCGHIFFGTTEVPTGDVYVRTWLKADTALSANHVSFITMPDTTLGGKHLRIGGQSSILMYNRESDDATLPDLSPQGIESSEALPAGSWQCFEYHLGTDGTIETWLNNATITGLTVTSGAENPNAAQWTTSSYSPAITGVYFGWESYSGDINTFWYDDIEIGSTRAGC
ncbi:hypothetical protein F4861DRAFT_233432 [Xylaria intraflava]|nr:hypothetical protein F4861DRAFT_233432 [Xylaria intraflava]